jgi:6-phosphofructokinase
MPASGKILVAQGGGPTAVINQSWWAWCWRRGASAIERIYGARHGVRGIVNEDFVDLTQETSHNLELVAGTPAAALGSTRDKPDLAYCQEIFKVLQAHEIEHFFYIGGNDSSDTVRIVSRGSAARPVTRCAASTSPRPSTTTWSATTTRRAFPGARASWRRPSPAPTSTTPPCPACMSAS